MTFFDTRVFPRRERQIDRKLAALAVTLANAWLPPGVMEAAAPLWAWSCVYIRQLRLAHSIG